MKKFISENADEKKIMQMKDAEYTLWYLLDDLKKDGIPSDDVAKVVLSLLYLQKRSGLLTDTNYRERFNVESIGEYIPGDDKVVADFLRTYTISYPFWKNSEVMLKHMHSIVGVVLNNQLFDYACYSEILVGLLADFTRGGYDIPRELADFVLKQSGEDLSIGTKILNAFSGFSTLGSMIPSYCSYTGYEISAEAYAISRMRLYLVDSSSTPRLFNSDILDCFDWNFDGLKEEDAYDFAFTFPPFGMKRIVDDVNGGRGEVRVDIASIELCQKLVKFNKRVIACVPISVLFAGKDDKEFRRRILGGLESVMLLPERIFGNTGLATALLTINSYAGATKFFDLRDCYKEGNSKGMRIFDKDKALSIVENNEYVFEGDKELIENKFDCDLYRPFFKETPTSFPTVRLGDIVEKVTTTTSFEKGKNISLLSEPAIVLSLIRSLKPRYENASSENPVTLSKESIAVKLKSTVVSVDYLIETLSTLNVYFRGAVIPRISEKDLMDVQIPLPSLEEQNKILADVYESRLSDKERELRDALESYKRDTHMKKHAIGQNMTELLMLWRNIDKLMSRNNGSLTDSMTYGDSTVAEMRKSMTHYITSVANMVNSFTAGDDAEINEKKDIDVFSFIQKYISTHSSSEFKYAALEKPQHTLSIHFSERLLEQVFNNIVYNAQSHGFKGRDAEKNIVDINVHVNKDNDVIIDIRNNGAPFDDGLTPEDILRYGFTTNRGTDGHGGIGCYQVGQIMKASDNSRDVQIISTPSEFYTVTFSLVFRNNKED